MSARFGLRLSVGVNEGVTGVVALWESIAVRVEVGGADKSDDENKDESG